MVICTSPFHCTRTLCFGPVHDLYLNLPLAPWEAVMGTTALVPPAGRPVHLKVAAGVQPGQQLRQAKRGLPKPHNSVGDFSPSCKLPYP